LSQKRNKTFLKIDQQNDDGIGISHRA